jgi:hypothetical protein
MPHHQIILIVMKIPSKIHVKTITDAFGKSVRIILISINLLLQYILMMNNIRTKIF